MRRTTQPTSDPGGRFLWWPAAYDHDCGSFQTFSRSVARIDETIVGSIFDLMPARA